MSYLDLFDELADEVRRRWAAHNHADCRFGDAAAASLEAINPATAFSADAFFLEISQLDEFSTSASPHGAPGILNIIETESFSVDVHIWTEEVAPPHSHNWVGAYQVLQGCVIHGQYSFHVDTKIRDAFQLGDLSEQTVDFNGPGHIRTVDAGLGFVHGLAYVSPIGMAVSLRRVSPGHQAHTIHRPHLAIGQFPTSRTRAFKMRALAQSARSGRQHQAEILTNIISSSDLLTVHDVFCHCLERGVEIPDRATKKARQRFGDCYDRFLTSLDELVAYRLATEIRRADVSLETCTAVGALFVADDAKAVRSILELAVPDADPEQYLGRTLSKILLNPEDGSPIPEPVIGAVTDIVRDRPLEAIIARLRERGAGDPHLENHCAVAAQLYQDMREAPLYNVLFKN